MKKIQLFLYLPLCFLLTTAVYAQPSIPKKDIPPDMPPDIKQQVELLYAKKAYDRAMAAYALGEMGPKASPAVPFLIAMFLDEATVIMRSEDGFNNGSSPKEESMKALVKIGASAVDPLIEALSDKNWKIKSAAAMILGDIGDPKAVEPLTGLLMNPDLDLVRNGAIALGKLNDVRAVQPLIDTFKITGEVKRRYRFTKSYKSDGGVYIPYVVENIEYGINIETVKGVLIDSLANIGTQGLNLLHTALKNPNSAIRRNVAAVLGRIKDNSSVVLLIESLKDKAWSVRAEAAFALKEMKDPQAVPGLIGLLKDIEPEVCGASALALGALKAQAAIEPLIEALQNGEPGVRGDVAFALGEIGDKRAVKVLIHLLGDEYVYARDHAAAALYKITGQTFGLNQTEWNKWLANNP
ncbi:MAG: HEAT repeat domain-containing protein [Bacillota bacterium]